jgi:GH35 family endo-1,4-beta-xylanase
MATTNLPSQPVEDSGAGTKLFFNNYGQETLEFNANDVNSTVSFFESKGFEKDAALVVSTVLLKQAKLDGTPIYQILQGLSQFDGLGLSQVVGEILNNNRTPTSTLGFRTPNVKVKQSRNIAA